MDLHWVAPQRRLLGQASLVTLSQAPVPVHLAAGVWRFPVQLSWPQMVVAGATQHAPAPSQVPSWPHGGEPTVHVPRELPCREVGEQVPDCCPLSAAEQA